MPRLKLRFKIKNFNLIAIIFAFSFIVFDFCQAAVLSLESLEGEFYQGDSFSADIILNTEQENINVLEVGLSFSPEDLEVLDIETGSSIFNLWAQGPGYSNEEGLIYLIGGLPDPGYSGSDGKIATIIFRAKKIISDSQIIFQENTKALLNDGHGQEVDLELISASYQFIKKPETLIQIYSLTHPNEAQWYNTADVSLNWGEEQEDIQFSYLLSRNSIAQPDNLSEGTAASINYFNLEDGIWYFHIKKFEAGVWGEAARFKIQIDTNSPLSFQTQLGQSDLAFEGKYFLSFSALDKLSGLERYEVSQQYQIKEPLEEQMWTIAKTPYILKNQTPGDYKIHLRAIDKAGNIQEEVFVFNIPQKKIFWLLTITIILILILSILLIVVKIVRQKRK